VSASTSRTGQASLRALRPRPFIGDRRGYSFTFWAVFIALVLGPLFALSIELGRYARAAGEVQKAADAAALAAVREVDVTLWREGAEFAFLPSAHGLAQEYAGRNAAYLGQYGINVSVIGIYVDPDGQLVTARCRADVSRLFPAWAPQVVIERQGAAQVAWR
jgi:Flp pilus assembly protein TadG